MFLLLFAFGEGILGEGYIHAVPAIVILLLMVALHRKPVLSAVVFFFLFVFSVWFFKTYNDAVYFFTLSAPLFVVSVLFLVGKKMRPLNM
jgi:hypothetical protein